MGYLLPTENVMQILGPALVLLAFGGGLFVPLTQFAHGPADAGDVHPALRVNALVHAPLTGDGVTAGPVANVVVWLVVFVGGAVWRFRRDTARV